MSVELRYCPHALARPSISDSQDRRIWFFVATEMRAPVLRLSLFLTAAVSSSAAPCYASFNNATLLETPCYRVEKRASLPSGFSLELRRYTGAEALMVQSNASAQITTYQEALMMTSFYIIDYFTGGNAANQSLLSSRTVPLTLHPPSSARLFWLGRMALAPSVWPPHSKPPAPPAPEQQELTIAPLGSGTVLLASIHKQFTSTPQPSDFDSLCASLFNNLGLLSATLDPASLYSPAHAYYYGEDAINPLYDAECWLGVTAA